MSNYGNARRPRRRHAHNLEQMQDPVERQVDAYNARDLRTFPNCYAPHTIVADGAGTTVMEVRDAMPAAYDKLFRASPILNAEIATRIRVGEYVIDEEVVTGRRGSPAPLHLAVVYHIAGGLIDHVRLIR
jgi:hypothetical protein